MGQRQFLTEPAFAEGYAICTPEGRILPHSFRRSEAEAIASVFTDPSRRDAHWEAAVSQGMSAVFVYARVFIPKFFVTVPPEEADAA